VSLVVKELRHRHLDSQFEKLRIWLVRFLSFLISCLSDQYSSSRRIPLVTELFKHLEEAARVKVLAQTQKSAFAIIVTGQKNERRYLLQWNANWRMFNLIGGKVDNNKGDNNCFRRTIERELEEELGVSCPQECRVGRELGQVRLRQFSHREQIIKNYHFALFDVSVLPDLPIDRDSPHYFARWLSTGRENTYVTAKEIQNLSTFGGRPISATTRHILQALGEIPHQPPSESN
jgi:8-oxo-dGTP pyrophosphatase MutT (NUDIX family)